MNASNDILLSFLLIEYEKLKEEQHKRIAFRDQMIYLTLGAIGAIFSFALEKPGLNTTLLVLPFLCIIMGWTYYANDLKISAIGHYIRTILVKKIELMSDNQSGDLSFTWEYFSNRDSQRKNRKLIQLFINVGIFALPGFVSIILFILLHNQLTIFHYVFSALEIIGLSSLSMSFVKSKDS